MRDDEASVALYLELLHECNRLCQPELGIFKQRAYDVSFDAWLMAFSNTVREVLNQGNNIDVFERILVATKRLIESNLYDARSRVVLLKTARKHGINYYEQIEVRLLDQEFTNSSSSLNTTSSMSTFHSKEKYWMKVGAGATIGAVAIGLTGGLAAPLVLGALTSSAVGAGAIAASTIGSGIVGAGFGGWKVNRRIADLSDFALLRIEKDLEETEKSPTHSASIDNLSSSNSSCSLSALSKASSKSESRIDLRLPNTIKLVRTFCVSGWLNKRADITRPWFPMFDSSESPCSEHIAVQFEVAEMKALGNSLRDMVTSTAATVAAKEILLKSSLSAAMAAVAWPLTAIQLGALAIDNPWAIGVERAKKAGRCLAQILLQLHITCDAKQQLGRNGVVNLVGYSLGALVIWECLRALPVGIGFIQSVLLMGLPVAPVKREDWLQARLKVTGRFVHCYSRLDWVLAYVHRGTISLQSSSVAGMIPIDGIPGLECIDCSQQVKGHVEWAKYPPDLLELLTP